LKNKKKLILKNIVIKKILKINIIKTINFRVQYYFPIKVQLVK